MLGRSTLIMVLVGFSVGCAAETGRRDTSSWLEARGADVMDTVGIRVGVGPGLGALVRVTEAMQLGFISRGAGGGELVGTSEHRARGVPVFMFGNIGRYGGAWFDEHHEIAFPGYSTREEDHTGIARKPIAGHVSPDGQKDGWKGSFGVNFHAILVGVEAEFRPFELVDFVAGLLGYDPSADDVPVSWETSAN